MKTSRRILNCIVLCCSVLLLGVVIWFERNHKVTIPVINEVCTRNFSVACAPNGSYYDYVELYNGTDADYTMTGLYLSDDREEPVKYDMSGITVPAGGYAIVWMTRDEDVMEDGSLVLEGDDYVDEFALNDLEEQRLSCDQYVCPFALASKGEYLFISNAEGRILDSVTVPALSYNTAYGNETDGADDYIAMEPTPGASNDGAAEIDLDEAPAPVLSAESGFYDAAFELSIAHALTTEVYYTLDGSTPTTESTRYTGSIVVEDVSGCPNVYSARDDIYIDNYVPEDLVDKATVVRAIAVDKATGAVSDVVSATYFVGFEEKSGYDNIAVISLITDPDNLFDYDTGIYVMGATYDEYIEAGGFEYMSSGSIPSRFSNSEGSSYIQWQYTNSEHHGRAWEREVTVEYYDASHTLQFSQDAGMRIAGELTRHFNQKSFNLYARGIYGRKEWQCSFWGYDIDTLRLRSSATEDVNWKETFLQSLTEGRSVSTAHSQPCAVFLDGEYWGMYQLTEQYNDDYFAHYYGVSADEMTVWKNNVVIQGDVEQAEQDLKDLKEVVTTYDMSADHLYQYVADRVNIDSLIDWFCAEVYFGNTDVTAKHNQERWRIDTDGADNRWQYVLYDLDVTCDDPAENTIAYYESEAHLYWPGYLCENAAFKQQYVTTMMDLANVEYSYQRVHARLAAKAGPLAQQAVKSKNRYVDADYDEAAYEADVARIDTFFRERRAYIEQYLAADLGLSDIAVLTVLNSDIDAGAVRVNSSVLTAEDYAQAEDGSGSWSGDYYTDYPVTLTAVAIDGYVFAGWSGDVTTTEETITVPMTTDGVHVQAVFVPAE